MSPLKLFCEISEIPYSDIQNAAPCTLHCTEIDYTEFLPL
ncbi:hypothetical protein TcasGA2_TC032994 [Tribolium castaneum]|uniref:Uncharacterized protein n=1 Tax=Tribolium castaneum TaxID=7070 RepID=A0A139WI98_TRICA|nr:hypothetical protein TcasGA2_TC032994 [Tribolium castaneum]